MSVSPVMSIADELVAELERECRIGAHDHGGMGNDYDSALVDLIGDTLLALLAERAELLRDAERYRWLRLADWWSSPICAVKDPKSQAKPGTDCPTRDRLDAAIDAAMQSEAKP